MDQNTETHAIIHELTRGLLTDAERTYYEYHGKHDDGNHIVDAYEEGYYAIEEAGL